MKKLSLGLGILCLGFAMNAFATLPSGNANVSLASCCGNFLFGVTSLYWRTSTPNQTFAASFDNSFPIREIFSDTFFDAEGSGHNHEHDPDYEWGYKLNVGYILPCLGYDLNLTYTHWDHGYDQTAANVIPPDGIAGLLNSTGPIFIPATLGPGPLVGLNLLSFLRLDAILTSLAFVPSALDTTARSHQEFDNHAWDLDFGQTIAINCLSTFHWYAGLRYSNLEYNFSTCYDAHIAGDTGGTSTVLLGSNLISLVDPVQLSFGGTFSSNIILDSQLFEDDRLHNKFNGLGPHIGFDFNYGFCGGFGVVGGISTALILGEHRASTSFRVQSQGTALFTNLTGLPFVDVGIAGVADSRTIVAYSPAFNSSWNDDTGTLTYSLPSVTRVVPNIDAKLGVNWIYRFGHCGRSNVSIEAGYMVSHYFNVIDFFEFPQIGNQRFEDYFSNTFNVTFDGPYASMQVAL